MSDPQKRTRSGRASKLAERAAPPVINPCPPGQPGGTYKPLSTAEMQAIYDTALRLLAELGMGETPDGLARRLIEAGATRAG